MKKIFFLALFFISLKTFGQYPQLGTLHNDSTLTNPKGALKSRLINFVFTDTTQANTQRIKQYPGAQIFTSTDNKLWLRNSTATAWITISGSSFDSTTIYNILNQKINYTDTAAVYNMFAFILENNIDTAYVANDTFIRFHKPNGITWDIPFQNSVITTITNNITQILAVIDSIRSDTTFALDGLEFLHDPSSRNDSIRLKLFTTSERGGVPPPLTVTGKFLKDDGTWDTPAGGGGNDDSAFVRTEISPDSTWKILIRRDGSRDSTNWIGGGSGGGGSGDVTADSVIVATSSQTVFPFTSVPASKDDFFVTVWGVLVDPDLYTVSGGITFLTGLVSGDKVRYHRTK